MARIVCALACLWASAAASASVPPAGDGAALTETVAARTQAGADPSFEQYAMIELPVEVRDVVSPWNVSVSAWVTFTHSASGRTWRTGAFLNQHFNRTCGLDHGQRIEMLAPSGEPFFAVRFACTLLGAYTYTHGGDAAPMNGSFTCIAASGAAQHSSLASSSPMGPRSGATPVRTPPRVVCTAYVCVNVTSVPGFVRVGGNGQFFEAEDGRGVWIVGENMAWSGVWPYFNGSSAWSAGVGRSCMYDAYLPRMAAAAGSMPWARLWLGPSLVREPTWDGETGSLLAGALMSGASPFGTYNLSAAARIDAVLSLGLRLGVRFTVVLDAQQAVCTPSTWCFWNDSAYNAANGGPLADPARVWTSDATTAELVQRWRYVLARWSWASSVFSWELANENDDWAGWGPDAAAFQLSVAALLRAEDPFGHLIDNSFANPTTQQPMESSPLIDFTSAHGYSAPDFAAFVWSAIPSRVQRLGKPAFVEEFGPTWTGPMDHELDPTGISMHNAAWASMCGLGAGSAMSWWWNEVDALNLYEQLVGPAAFAQTVLEPMLLNFTWMTWNNSTGPTAPFSRGGWMVGTSGGVVGAIVAWIQNVNHTWSNMHAGGTVLPIQGTMLTLHGLSLPPTAPEVTWYNTTTAEPLAASLGSAVTACAPGDVCLLAPTFLTDVAAVAVWSSAPLHRA